jgi:hypothetical protein
VLHYSDESIKKHHRTELIINSVDEDDDCRDDAIRCRVAVRSKAFCSAVTWKVLSFLENIIAFRLSH